MKHYFVFAILTLKLFLTVNALANSEEMQNVEIPIQENPSQETSVQVEWKGEPVVVFGDTLFYLKTRVGSFTPKERAEKIAKRIEHLCDDYTYKSEKLKVVAEGNHYVVMYGDIIIVTISNEEAEANNSNQKIIATRIKQKIIDKVDDYRKETSLNYIFKEIILALLLIFSAFFAIKIINKLYKKVFNKILAFKGSKIKGISIKSYNIFNENQLLRIVLTALKVFKYFVIILLLYLCLPLLFSIFPVTHGIANTLLGYVINPARKIFLAVFNYIPNLIAILVIVFVFRYVIKILKFFSQGIQSGSIPIKGFYPDWAIPTFNIIRVLLIVFMVVIIFPLLPGSETPVFKGVSIFVGVIISLGSTNLIGNLVAGLVLTYMRPFQIGDRIKIAEIEGNVVEKTPFVVRIRTSKNEEITIPNSNILSANTVNYTASAANTKVAVYLSVTVGYDVPWRQVHQLLLDAAAKTTLILQEPKPFVLQTAFNDFYIDYQINAFISDVNKMPSIYSDLRQNIQDIFSEAEIDMLSKHYFSLDSRSD